MNPEYIIENNDPHASVSLTVSEPEPGVTLLGFSVTYDEATVPSPIDIIWLEPCIDILSEWTPRTELDRSLGPNWRRRRSPARLASSAPVMQWISGAGENRLCVAISDAETPTEISGGIHEETATLRCHATFFTQPLNKMTSYSAVVRLDRRRVRYEQALRAADRFWVENGYRYAYVPDAARDAVYSCWYSFHQNVHTDAVLAQCRLAKELGMETVIVDDGWQTDDVSRGYAQCGDWKVAGAKIPSMRELADGVHALGMKLVIWYSVPFIGKNTKAYERFSDMTLGVAGRDFEALDPRFPEVRQYLIGLYTDAAREWGIDGFKLDFIDAFSLKKETPPTDPRRDTESLEEGVDRLLAEATAVLRAINPEVLIEFRETYYGPAVRKYGNMFRVGDCPDDPMRNRAKAVGMRYILGDVPVHSDMLMWNDADTPEAVAYQMMTVLPTVPQISVLLDRIPAAQYEVLAFWLGFWRRHRDTLLLGDIEGDNPEALYSRVRMTGKDEGITVCYTDPTAALPALGRLYVCNATCGTRLILTADAARTCRITVRDHSGNVVGSDERTLTPGAHIFEVPAGGMLKIE